MFKKTRATPADCQGTAPLGTNYCVKQAKYDNKGNGAAEVDSICTGDCDNDNDCDYGLKCFQREPGTRGPDHCSGLVSVDMMFKNTFQLSLLYYFLKVFTAN